MQKQAILTVILLLAFLTAASNSSALLERKDVKWLTPEETVLKVYPDMKFRKKIELKGHFIDADFAQLTKNFVVAEKYQERVLIHFYDEKGNELWSRQIKGHQKEGLLYISKNGKTIVYNAIYLIDEENGAYDVSVFNDKGEMSGSMIKSDWDLKPSESGKELYILTNTNHEMNPIKNLMYYDTSLNKHFFMGFINDAYSVSYKVINDSLLISFKDYNGLKHQRIEFYKKDRHSIKMINQFELNGSDGLEAPFCLERCFWYNDEMIFFKYPGVLFDFTGNVIRSSGLLKAIPIESGGFYNYQETGKIQYNGNVNSKYGEKEIDFIEKVYGRGRIDKVKYINDYILFYEDMKMADPDILSFYDINSKNSFSYDGKAFLSHPDVKIFQHTNCIYFYGRGK